MDYSSVQTLLSIIKLCLENYKNTLQKYEIKNRCTMWGTTIAHRHPVQV